MAIYSLHHSTVGRSTHAAGTAGAHVAYVTRSSACREVVAQHIPAARPGSRGGAARAWMDEAEASDRKNARVIDKLMLALPRELDEGQRVDLVRGFVAELGGGKDVPFLAAFHDKAGTKDAANPHCHLILRDRDPETGKGRVIGMSEKGSTERAREVWERVTNAALEAAGSDARIDRRSLQERGVTDREPSAHEGPQARAIAAKHPSDEEQPASIKLALIAEQAAQAADERRRRREADEQWEALRRERIDRAERRAARREEAERLKRDQWERERLQEAYYADEWRLQRDRDLSEGLLLDGVLGESLRLYWLGDERQFEELVGQSEALTALCSDPWHEEAAKVLEPGALEALRRGAGWAETLREMAERLPQEAARLEAEAQVEAQRVASEAEAKRFEAAQAKCIQRRDDALAGGDLLAAASWEGNLRHWAGDMERHSAMGARLEALDVLLASLEGQSKPVNVLLDPDRVVVNVFDTLAAAAIEAIRAAADAGADWCDTCLLHLAQIEARLPGLVEAERAAEAERAEAAQKHAAWAEAVRLKEAQEAEVEIAAERERERELAAAEARREAEVRERLAAQAARARVWAAEMSGGGLAALRRRAGAPARFAAARDTALDAGDLDRAGRAEAARQAWYGAATAARELMDEVEELEALKTDPLARAAATEIEPPMARAVVDEAAAGGGWADSLRTFIRDTIQTIRDVLAQFHARRAPSAPAPAPALLPPEPEPAPAPRPSPSQPVATKPVPPAPAPKLPLPRIVFAELPSQGGVASFRDWKRLARARLLWERQHNGGSGPLIDYLDGLAGEDRSYEHDLLFERLRTNWQGNGTYRLALVALLAGLGGSVDAATGYDYDPEPPPRFRPNGLLVLEMAKAREQCDGKLTLSGAAAVVRAVAQSVPLTFEDVAYAASEFSRDAGVPWIWKMVQEPASKPEAPAPPASGPSRREPDRGPGW